MQRFAFGVCAVLLVIASAWVVAQETLPQRELQGAAAAQANGAARYSYAIGLDLGRNFRDGDTQLDIENLVSGVRDGLGGVKPKLDEQACAAAIHQLNNEMERKMMAKQHVAGAENRKLGAAFLAKNRQQPGVQVTESGLQYKVINAAKGLSPKLTDTVRCNYRGTLINGTLFDASDKHGGPAEFPVNRVIPGWTEALQLMSVGEKWQLFIPADLAYGDQQKGPLIAPGSTLIFEIELLGIVGK